MKTQVDEVKYTEAEFLASVLSRYCDDAQSFEIGNAMPIPASAALMVYKRNEKRPRLSILGSVKHNLLFTGGILEQYDLGCKGMIDVQFYGGGQIDGQGNINLVGIGDYPRSDVRFAGSFGTSLLYYVGLRTILFVTEHSKRVLVPKVDFISAAGVLPEYAHRLGGPIALVTSKCVMTFCQKEAKFTLKEVHPGFTVDDIKENTGFDFECPSTVPTTGEPTDAELELLRTYVKNEVAEVYPVFAKNQIL
ncbi:MAG: CoA synthetase [Burkholderiaceae bacterium]|nr:CoA synthetase [Burkholderiaceae bacterium]